MHRCINFETCGRMAYQQKNGDWYCDWCHPDGDKIRKAAAPGGVQFEPGLDYPARVKSYRRMNGLISLTKVK